MSSHSEGSRVYPRRLNGQLTEWANDVLDLVFTNSVDLISNVSISSDHSLSDHFPIVLSINQASHNSAHCSYTVLDYSRTNFSGVCDFLGNHDFSMLYQSSDAELIWSTLKSAISTAVSLFTPTRVIHNGSHPVWFNSGIRHKINKLNTLKRKKSSSSCLSRIADLEAQLKDDITSAKSQYESELVLNFSYSDSSKVFKYIKSATKQSILPQVMSLNTSSAHTDEEKAELFNKFFFSVYTNNSNEAFTPVTNSLPTLDDIVFDVSDVFRILASLDTTKAMGIDGIGPLVLKSCADVLCVPIHHLFTVSLSNGYIPSEWRIHLITPVFKSGDKSSIKNYRPISLLCSVSKVLEKIIFSRVSDFVADSISSSQFGFMRGRSSQQ